MRIGIDFDNTIACYSSVFGVVGRELKLLPEDFTGDKNAVKSYLLQSTKGEQGWMTVQGQVYGAYISRAQVFDGFGAFLKRCVQSNAELFIISHKTQFGHFDAKGVDLREAARGWLAEQGISGGNAAPIDPQQVFFLSTRDEKVEMIRDLQCTHFVDDLMDVLTHDHFPKMTRRFLFKPDGLIEDVVGIAHCRSWQDVDRHIF